MLKSLVVAGVRMLPGKAVAKREGAVRIFAAPLFFFAIALLLGGGYIVEDQFTSPAASQSYALFAGAFFIATSITRSFFTWRTATAKTRPTFGRTSPAPIGGGPTWLAHRATRVVA